MIPKVPIVASYGTVLVEQIQKIDPATNSVLVDKTQVGGGAFYGAIGARIWLPASSIKVLVDIDECPPKEFDVLNQFGSEIWYFRKGKGTVRSLIRYNGPNRTFKYLHAPDSVFPQDVKNTTLQGAKYIHIVASPLDLVKFANQLDQQYQSTSSKLVYEVHPKYCNSQNLNDILDALKYVQVFSPNHEEILDILNQSMPQNEPQTFEQQIETAAKSLLSFGDNFDIVIRCGSKGSCVADRQGNITWVPAFWTAQDAEANVIDTTGAGNSFLGGLISGLELENSDLIKAVCYGSVSASFVIQQDAAPTLSLNGLDRSLELWNNDSPKQRLNNLLKRISV